MESVIAVTGASGSLGRVLLDRLASAPSVEKIVAIDRVEPRWTSPKVEFRNCDVRDPEIEQHLRGCGAVVHLAFIVESGSRDAQLVQDVNVGGTTNIANAAAKAGARQLVHASSIASYGFHPENLDGLLTEDSPTRGNEDFYYARTKAECEHFLAEFDKRHPALKVARLRPSIFLGPRSSRSIERFRKRVFPFPSGPGVPAHVTHEDDVVEAFFLALEREAEGAFNIATDEPLPVCEWPRQMGKRGLRIPRGVLRFADLAYKAKLIDVDPVWLRVGGQYPILVSSKKARRELRWRPRYDHTGQALRAFADAPTAVASLGTKLLFGGGAVITRLRGGLPVDERDRAEMMGMNGIANIVFTGERPSEWRVELRDNVLAIRPGIHADAKATITMKEKDFSAMLAGTLDMSRASMTGKIRTKGDSTYNFLIGGIVGGFQRVQRGGPAARMFANLVLKGNGVSAQHGG
jgi:nucleoside-diphosphate-sugar epimerase